MKEFGMNQYVVYGFLAVSVVINGYQVYRMDNMREVVNLVTQKDQLTQSGYSELLYNHINSLRNDQIEASRNQGKIEGIISVVNNAKPEANEISSIWHSGYYRGMDQVEFVRVMAYEDGYHRATEDISCPAGNSTNNKTKIGIKPETKPETKPIK